MIWEEDKDKRSESDLKEDSCIGCMGKIIMVVCICPIFSLHIIIE